jgi:hypothetical protein
MRAASSRTTARMMTARSQRAGRLARDLELVGAVLGQEVLGFHPGLVQRGHQQRTERIRAPQRGERERRRMRPGRAGDLELLLERGNDPQAGLGVEIRQRLLEDAAHAAVPGVAVEIRDVREIEVERRGAGQDVDAGPGAGVRDQPQIAGRAPRVRARDGVERRQREVGRDPADALAQVRVEIARDDAAPPGDRDQIRGEERHQLQAVTARRVLVDGAHRLSSAGAASCR